MSAVKARLLATRVPSDPEGAVLVLHGGGSRRGNMMVSPTQLSVVRMVPIADRIARAGSTRLAVFRLLNSVRGWDTRHTPVDDVRWALAQLRERFGGPLPTSLVGHSLGGRAALLAAGEPEVRSAVALAPWVYPTDGAAALPGRQILIVHGTKDRIANPSYSATVARALSASAEVGYISVLGGKHAMLKRHATFDGLAADYVMATLLGVPPGESDDTPVSRVLNTAVSKLLSGERWLEI